MCMAGILYQFTWLQCVWAVFYISLLGYNVYGRYFISVNLVTMCMDGILYQFPWLQCVWTVFYISSATVLKLAEKHQLLKMCKNKLVSKHIYFSQEK